MTATASSGTMQRLQRRISGRPLGAATTMFWISVLVTIPTMARALLDPLLGNTLWFPTYYPAALVAGLFLGLRPALVIVVVSALVVDFVFMPPRFAWATRGQDIAGVAVFVLADSMIVISAVLLRSALLQLTAANTREQLLNRELQHRIKNMLAIVQGLALQTFRSGNGDQRLFIETLQGRLNAFGSAHDLLARGQWETCELRSLVEMAMAPFQIGERIIINGAEGRIPADSCVPLILALHELATNAVKYGALSNAEGVIRISWAKREGETENATPFVLHWMETGGPSVQQPSRRGLGSRLIKQQNGLEFVELSFKPEGVCCEIHLQPA